MKRNIYLLNNGNKCHIFEYRFRQDLPHTKLLLIVSKILYLNGKNKLDVYWVMLKNKITIEGRSTRTQMQNGRCYLIKGSPLESEGSKMYINTSVLVHIIPIVYIFRKVHEKI